VTKQSRFFSCHPERSEGSYQLCGKRKILRKNHRMEKAGFNYGSRLTKKNRRCEERSDGLKTKERFFAKEAQNDHKLAYEKKPASITDAGLQVKFF